jgi:hypothetical protein
MKHIYFFLFLIFPLLSSAQTINIQIPNGEICTSKKIPIKFTTNGSFGPNNRFKIELLHKYYRPGTSIIETKTITVSEEGLSNPMEIVIPDDISSSFGQLRVVSTDPVISSPWSNNVYFKFLITATLSGDDLTNSFEPVPLKLTVLKGAKPYELSFLDSTGAIKTTNSFGANYILNPEKTTTYKITQVSNECGIGTITGEQKVRVNPINFRFIRMQIPSAACVGDKGIVTIDSDKPFTAENKFSLVLYKLGPISTPVNEIRLPLEYVSEKNYSFVVSPGLEGYSYHARVESSQPYCLTTNFLSLPIIASFKLKILTEELNIPYGTKADIRYEFSGNIDHNENLLWASQNAFKVPITNTVYNPNINDKQKTITVEPLMSDTYSISKAPYHRCGRASVFEGNTKVNVTTGFNISPNNKTLAVCENEKVDIIIKKFGSFPPNNKFKVEFSFAANNPIFFDAYLINDSTLRVDHIRGPNPGKPALGNLWVISSNPEIRSLGYVKIEINTVPNLTFPTNNVSAYNVNAGNSFELPVGITGRANYTPCTILINDGKSDFRIKSTTVLPIANTSYQIKEISGECGKTNFENKKINVTVSNPQNIKQSIALNLHNEQIFCRKNSIAIPFVVNGETDLSDEYIVEAQYSQGNIVSYIELGSSKSYEIKIIIPEVFTNYNWLYIRVTNKKRKISSGFITIKIDDVPKAQVLNFSQEILMGSEQAIQYKATGHSEMLVEFSSGEKKIQPAYTGGSDNYYISKRIFTNSSYSISKISNGCGVGTSEGKADFVVKPYKLIIQHLPVNRFCEGETVKIPFEYEGIKPEQINIQAQISESPTQNYGDIPTKVEGNFVVVTLPQGTLKQNPNFYIKIIDVNQIGFPSSYIPIILNKKPEIKLTAVDNTDKAITSTTSLDARLKIVNLNNAYGFEYGLIPYLNINNSYSYTEPRVSPTSKTNYSIKYVYNECGYGKYQGSVEVKVSPTLALKNIPLTGCIGSTIKIDYATKGDFETNNVLTFELQSQSSGKLTSIGESKNNENLTEFKIPNDLPSGSYYLRVSTSTPVLSASSSTFGKTINIGSSPVGELFGNTVSNTGDKVYLNLKMIGDLFPIKYVLSDGTNGSILYQSTSKIYPIAVSPKTTTNYSISELSNACGMSKSDKQVKVTINASQALNIFTTNVMAVSGKICTGKNITISYTTSGVLKGNENFIAQISDINGDNFINLKTFGNISPLTAELPSSLTPGDFYRIRVVANSPSSSSAYHSSIPIKISPTAQLLTNQLIYEPNKEAVANLKLSGSFPIYFSFGIDSLKANIYQTNDSLFNLSFKPILNQNSVVYKIFNVGNSDCGLGKIVGNNKLLIELLTANEPLFKDLIEIYPNPTEDFIKINTEEKTFSLKLVNSHGKILIEHLDYNNKELNISNLAQGLYYLTINQSTFKVIKL